MKTFILEKYIHCFNFIAKERIAKKDLHEKYIHAHLVCIITTGILMWSYAIVACLTFGLPIAKNCVDRINGNISYETRTSMEGPSGTRFKILLPADQC